MITEKNSLCHEEYCMKKIYTYLREHATNVINFQIMKILPLTKKSLKLHQN